MPGPAWPPARADPRLTSSSASPCDSRVPSRHAAAGLLARMQCSGGKQRVQRQHHIEEDLANHLGPPLLEPGQATFGVTGSTSAGNNGAARKRQMYGRANRDLLRMRILLAG
jgi:hypothetical protein